VALAVATAESEQARQWVRLGAGRVGVLVLIGGAGGPGGASFARRSAGLPAQTMGSSTKTGIWRSVLAW
jgi:hypothetical protein